jgi:iron complex outermembrane receptor protein
MRVISKLLIGVSGIALAAAITTPTMAQGEEIEEVVVVGSRSSQPRSAADSPVPVDAFSGAELRTLGNSADMTDNLRTFVPSYTATPATGDGSAFVRPTSLRGLAPDQTLVLVNGKRRHRSALVHFFAPAAGNGSHGVDIGMIPSIALKRVEVLRDGAAAQYGSDAIAGVINFVLRDEREGVEGIAQYGQYYEGEYSLRLSAFGALPMGDTGFINLSVDYVKNEALSRGIQRPDAQALIDAGVQGVGEDAPFGDEPLVQTWGRPYTEGVRLFVNSGIEMSPNAEFYFHGNYADTEGRYRFFYRPPDHPTIVALNDLGFVGLLAGYTPFLDGDLMDFSAVGGVRGELDGGWTYDLSVGYGKSELDYFLNNTLNQSLGLIAGQPAQRDFIVGGYNQKEINLNADFTKQLRDNLFLAFGGEWREETYVVIAGEPNSFFGAGSNGLGGFSPADAGSFSRDNFAFYVDVEHDISEQLMVQYALRYEDFSDFGGTINGKIAARYSISDRVNLRAAFSSGFHAPTPGQANVRTTITTFDGVTGLQVEEGLVPPTSPGALAVGGAPLTEEKSLNYSAGFTADVGNSTTLTVDFYQINVRDHIYRTGDIPVPGSSTGATISFFTNALDVRSRGIDVVLNSNFEWSDMVNSNVSLAASYNQVAVTDQIPVVTPSGPITPVSDSIVEDIENNYPNLRFVLTTNTFFAEKWNFMARANFYGSHWDERGRIGASVDPTAKIKTTVYFDAELGFQFNEHLRFVAGAVNVFDSFIDVIGPPNSNRLSVGLQYPRRSAANYEGGSWYLRAHASF